MQSDFGGSASSITADRNLIEQVEKILQLVPHPLLYARVDGNYNGSEFTLMELELIEPALFFRLDENAAGAFAKAVERRIPSVQAAEGVLFK